MSCNKALISSRDLIFNLFILMSKKASLFNDNKTSFQSFGKLFFTLVIKYSGNSK